MVVAGKPGTREEREARNARIVELASAGVAQRDIAREVGLASVKQVQRVLARASEAPAKPSPLPEPQPEAVVIDPRLEVWGALAELRQVAREARRLAGEARQESTQVAALKLLASLPLQRIELLGEFGALPPGPQWLTELRAAAMSEALIEVAAAAGLDTEELREVTVRRIAEHVSYEESGGMLELAELAPVPRQREAAA